jgi:hypothetical protein
VIAYKPSTNELLVIECKSYLDSPGVMLAGFHGKEDATKDFYEFFNRARLRDVVIATLIAQLRREGLLLGDDPRVRLVLVAGRSARRMNRNCGRYSPRTGGRSLDRARLRLASARSPAAAMRMT